MNTLLDVDFCHCFAARRHARLLTRLYDRHLAEVGLSISQFSILAVINERPEIFIAELADVMVMERTTLVRALKPLQTEGLLISDASGPRGALRLSLSAKGHATLEKAQPLWRAAQEEREAQVGADQAIALRDSILGQGT
ncbi:MULTISPECIES: MarR family winged helix-turn-helix transcriptional regulator [unclassified Pseudomonas]|uniref:MarR family winged helix-turn-helix transcriptional regulator n=1 Tax=unclassified Pseudomonas TaxID=196821 RepID=UPI000D34409D|nr:MULTISPECIES: MarR family winged helix-turn-helix transcriptional regulator [unclassified Pseudomonas]RAU47616.1 MarR family transcriptional regulator [Pseudomonas sp. RIT 409]RAU52044.1 MarR family transcriptional regulator [Pseudomonas sp. RIT 412]